MNEDKEDSKNVQMKARGSQTPGQGGVVERLSKYGLQVMPSAFQRRTRLQRLTDTSATVPERTSITTAMRNAYVKELSISKSQSGFSSVTSQAEGGSAQGVGWTLYQMEHGWTLSAAEGNYDTLLEYLSEEPNLLTRRDFISGYTVLHWLAKKGQDETLLKLLTYASELDVNVRGSGGLTPLHLASIHGHYMVVKLLVGAFGANVETMDYNGKRAWQYLKGDAPLEMKELLGMWDEDHSFNCNNSTEIFETTIWDQVDGDAQQRNYERTRNGWGLDSFRKLLQSFTLFGNNAGS
ncbi:ankyrin repeat domain-containing protein SOWAHD [Eucyclogobius newberryi]|uniref:ankyrin repeat domain-containing protein SOWAHD n=1 Tax=Eucyclogobius newberryi TaxID=166745 RepID=UPI003B5CD641